MSSKKSRGFEFTRSVAAEQPTETSRAVNIQADTRTVRLDLTRHAKRFGTTMPPIGPSAPGSLPDHGPHAPHFQCGQGERHRTGEQETRFRRSRTLSAAYLNSTKPGTVMTPTWFARTFFVRTLFSPRLMDYPFSAAKLRCPPRTMEEHDCGRLGRRRTKSTRIHVDSRRWEKGQVIRPEG